MIFKSFLVTCTLYVFFYFHRQMGAFVDSMIEMIPLTVRQGFALTLLFIFVWFFVHLIMYGEPSDSGDVL